MLSAECAPSTAGGPLLLQHTNLDSVRCTMQSLPVEMLYCIFAVLGSENACILCFVSRLWYRVARNLFSKANRMSCRAITASPSLIQWAHDLGAVTSDPAGVCKAAVEHGDMEVMECLLALADDCPKLAQQLHSNTCDLAASCGALVVLQWARGQGFAWSDETCASAARGGHLEVVQWARAHGCRWDRDTCRRAAEGGHLELLQWAVKQGLPADGAPLAAREGHLEVLKWMFTQHRFFIGGWRVSHGAGQGGHLDVIEWLQSEGFDVTRAWSGAAAGGHIYVLEWLRSNSGSVPIDEYLTDNIFDYAAEHDHMKVLEWALSIGLRPQSDHAIYSIHLMRRGDFDMLQRFKDHGCPIAYGILMDAAKEGNYAGLEWCKSNGIGWNSACYFIACCGNLDMLRWARAQGSDDWGEDVCWAAARGGWLDTLQWLRANGCPWDESTCKFAASNGHLEVLQWARANGCPWDSDTICWFAGRWGHFDVLKWTHANGCTSVFCPGYTEELELEQQLDLVDLCLE